MKQLAIVSGKGGTGKTVFTASFAVFASQKVLVDCDVDAANLHLLLNPEVQETHIFQSGQTALLDPDKCTRCGECFKACRFDAVLKSINGEFRIDPLACEGCTVCRHICPAGAIEMEESISGEWYISQTSYGPFVHARLGIAAENSGKLVSKVRERAKEIAEQQELDLVIIDGPPGIGCPVIASLSGVDMALIVAEPTPSGIVDMERVVHTARHFGITPVCCINKYDLNPGLSKKIERFCETEKIPLAGRVPYDPEVINSVIQKTPLPEFHHTGAAESMKKVWNRVNHLLNEEDTRK